MGGQFFGPLLGTHGTAFARLGCAHRALLGLIEVVLLALLPRSELVALALLARLDLVTLGWVRCLLLFVVALGELLGFGVLTFGQRVLGRLETLMLQGVPHVVTPCLSFVGSQGLVVREVMVMWLVGVVCQVDSGARGGDFGTLR
jgi:hypothetical protein